MQETSVPSVGFEPAIPVMKQSQTYNLHKYWQEHLSLKYNLITCHLLGLEFIFEGNIAILSYYNSVNEFKWPLKWYKNNVHYLWDSLSFKYSSFVLVEQMWWVQVSFLLQNYLFKLLTFPWSARLDASLSYQ